MNSSPSATTDRLSSSAGDPVVVGTVAGLLSAVGYTAANICLRAVAGEDAVWVTCLKAVPTVALTLPWMLYLAWRGDRVWPSRQVLVSLALAALWAQLAGNVAFQWSLGIIGLAVSVPLTLGTIILSGAVMGRLLLHEPVSPRMALAMGVLVAAIVVLSCGVGGSGSWADSGGVNRWLWVLAGVAAACLAGFGYAVLGVVIRRSVVAETPLSTTMFVISIVGVASLGLASLVKLGPDALWATEPAALRMMLMAGFWNAVAFVTLTKALKVTGVVYVNALNATQVALAAVAGVALFGETPTWTLRVGVTLTAAGLLMMRKPRPDPGRNSSQEVSGPPR